jgi:hypothetical protein
VLVCHNAGGGTHTLDISSSAVAAHLAHGDMLGHCNADLLTTGNTGLLERKVGDFNVTVLPNPSTNFFTIRVKSDNDNARLQMKVMDILGRIVERRSNLQNNQSVQVGDHYQRGVYFVEISDGRMKEVIKLIRQ